MVENFPELMKDSYSYRNFSESQPVPSRVCIVRQNTRKKVQKTKVNKKNENDGQRASSSAPQRGSRDIAGWDGGGDAIFKVLEKIATPKMLTQQKYLWGMR